MLIAWLAGLFGLLIGSFLNVCIYRLPRDLSVVAPRSFCPSCRATIAWYDNVPVLSYLLLCGSCRVCKAPISIRYPLVELFTGVCFFVAFSRFPLYWPAAKICVFSAILIVLIVADFEERILPEEFTLGGTFAGLVFAVLVPLRDPILDVLPIRGVHLISLSESALAAVVSGGTLWLIGALYHLIRRREGLGLGDVFLMAMVGSFVGLEGALLTIIVG
ncbi:MAG: prepilin peptidase, partial [Bryobacteraceae bacterium]